MAIFSEANQANSWTPVALASEKSITKEDSAKNDGQTTVTVPPSTSVTKPRVPQTAASIATTVGSGVIILAAAIIWVTRFVRNLVHMQPSAKSTATTGRSATTVRKPAKNASTSRNSTTKKTKRTPKTIAKTSKTSKSTASRKVKKQ